MITFGDICGLAFLIGFPTLIIKWLMYECQTSKEKEMWNAMHNEIDNFVQFLASLKSANEISVREIDWYVSKYCRIEREEITDDFMLEALDRSDELFGRHFIVKGNCPFRGETGKFNLMEKYKNTENFNEVEFFQELNEKLRKFAPKERHRVELAINKGRYLNHANYGQYICDFNKVLKLDVIDLGYRLGKYTDISLKDGEGGLSVQGDEIVELFNKWKIKQEKFNLINHL